MEEDGLTDLNHAVFTVEGNPSCKTKSHEYNDESKRPAYEQSKEPIGGKLLENISSECSPNI